MKLSDHDKKFIEAMFIDHCTVPTVQKVFPQAHRSSLSLLKHNFDCFGTVCKPNNAKKPAGRPSKITPYMSEWLIDLLAFRNDLWQEELVFELWCQFDVSVNKSTISWLLKNARISNKVNTRIASRRDPAQQGEYQEKLAELMQEGVVSRAVEDPADMLLYLDESAASEKVLFRRRSWSQIGHPAYTTSELVSKTRCSVLPALSIDGYLPGSTLVVEGAVTQEIFEHWLETAILPRCEPFPGKRSIVIMDNCSTHHSEKVNLPL
jgi:transposase